MSSNKSALQINQQKLEQIRIKRLEKLTQIQGSSTVAARQEGGISKKEFSTTKSESIQIPSSTIETYEQEVQCVLETRSLDSKPATHEQDDDAHEVDLLQPKEHRRRRDEHRREQQELQAIKAKQLTQEELDNLVKSKNFSEFFNKSSKFLEKVLHNGDGNMIELLLKEGIKTKQSDAHTLTVVGSYSDPNFTKDRVVTDIDWSTQIPELFLTSYSKNQLGTIKDHVGVVLIWTPNLKTRPEFHLFCQSAVTSAKFFPYANSTVVGGCANGQLMMWDFRVKAMPVQRSGISADGHKYPVSSLNVVGTQIANNIISYSNDGTMCIWDIKQFSRPIKNSTKLSAHRPTRNVKAATTASLASRVSVTATSVLDKKDDVHDVNVTCCQFPLGDANKYYVGSLNGAMYKNTMHNNAPQKIVMYDQHEGPISAISINNPSSEYQALSGLVLTSSYDWTVKLWSPNNNKESIRTFEHSDDYIYDVCWNPSNPSIFASVNNDGAMDLFDLTKDMEQPLAHVKINSNAQNKCRWNGEGSIIASGDSAGNVSLLVLNEKLRRIENAKLDDFETLLAQAKEEP